MAIQFEFYKNPQPEKEGEEPSYHQEWLIFSMSLLKGWQWKFIRQLLSENQK